MPEIPHKYIDWHLIGAGEILRRTPDRPRREELLFAQVAQRRKPADGLRKCSERTSSVSSSAGIQAYSVRI